MPTPESEVQTLLFAAAGGDEGAWRRIVGEYSPRVFALLRAQCHNPDLAEEIAQSTFCTVAIKLPEYTELGKFESWLFRIAMNRLRDEMRRRSRHAVAVESDALAAMAGEGAIRDGLGPEAREDILSLRRAMARLTDADRQVLHLRHYGGLSFKQIAEMLDQPLGTVLARQHRALQKLADLMSAGTPDIASPGRKAPETAGEETQ